MMSFLPSADLGMPVLEAAFLAAGFLVVVFFAAGFFLAAGFLVVFRFGAGPFARLSAIS